MALITHAQLVAYPGFDGVSEADVAGLLKGASALVELITSPVVLDAATLPPAIEPVLVDMVRRGLNNPHGRSSEQLGDYGWQGQGATVRMYPTREEKRIIRMAAGRMGANTSWLEGPLPLPASRYAVGYSGSDDLLGG